MKLVFAQCNPEDKYQKTRHNIACNIIDAFIDSSGGAGFQEKSKFLAKIAELSIKNEKVIFVKPTTYYNLTGNSLRALTDFYKLDPSCDILVVHDDLSLPFGTIRVREKGSDAGNNGIKSLNEHIGQSYMRLRVGIQSSLRGQMDDAAFVLSTFSKKEQEQLSKLVIPAASQMIDDFISEKLEITSHNLIK